jgi:hypothetical protein
MLYLDALFLVLSFMKVDKFTLIIEGLGRAARSVRIFCVIYIVFSVKKFIFVRSTSIVFLCAEEKIFFLTEIYFTIVTAL